MAIELEFDPLTSEPREKELPIPVRATDPSRGVVLVTLRDIPRGRYSALMSALQTANGALSKVLDLEVEQTEALLLGKDSLSEVMAMAVAELVNVEKLGEAWQLLFMARKAFVRWGVCGHNPDSFKTKKKEGEPPTPTPFESVTEVWESAPYALCGGRMIALYSHPMVGLMGNLSYAVRAFNEDRWESPEQIWEKANKKAAEPAKKEGEAKAVPPKKAVKKR